MADSPVTSTLYLDDSGTKEYEASREYSRNGNTRYFVFGGFLAKDDEASRLAQRIIDLKKRTFGRADVEVKSNWLRMPKERERKYLKPFRLGDGDLTAFVDAYYDLICKADVRLLAAVIDKVHMQEDFRVPWYSPAPAYEILLQRAEMAAERGTTYSVTIDDMTGATPKHNQYKENLKRQHARLKSSGSSLRRGFTFPGLRGDIRFLNSAHSHLVQMADVVSYNVYRQFVEHGDKWEAEGLQNLPAYSYLGRIAPKFRTGPGGRVTGYGIIKFPTRNKVLWAWK